MPGIRSRGGKNKDSDPNKPSSLVFVPRLTCSCLSGCWSCRQKRRKCDEAKPSCETCKTRGIVCGGYEMRFTEFRAQGNYSGQLVCKLARGSAPENGPTKSTRRRGPAATRRTSTTRQLSPPPPPPKPPPQPSVPAPDNASTQSAPANQSQDSVCSLPAGTADEVLPDRPPAVFGPTPPPLQGTETGPEEPQGCQNCRRLSSTAASQTNVSPARSVLAASYSPATSQNDMATHRPSGSDSDRQDQDWGILEPADALGLDAHLGFGTQDDGIWHLMQSDLDAPIGLWTPTSPRQDVGLLELAEISNNDHQHVEQGVGQDMHEFSTDSMEGLDDLPRPQVDPGPQTAGILSREAMVLLDIDSSAASTFGSHDGLGLSSFSTSIQDITSYSDFSSPFDTYLFSHFFSVLAPGFYPVAPHHNPFKLVYGKLASICPPLRATILGASALHLGGMSQLPPGVVSLYRDASRVSFSTAVKSRRRTEALAATILLSIIADVRFQLFSLNTLTAAYQNRQSIGSGTACWTSKLGLVRSLLQDKAVTPPSPDSAIVMSFLHLHFSWMTAIARTVKWHDSSLADADTLEFIEGSFIRPVSSYFADWVGWLQTLFTRAYSQGTTLSGSATCLTIDSFAS
ncbi:hypothetical protein FALCPG4_012529 [Fusarium falciforme]